MSETLLTGPSVGLIAPAGESSRRGHLDDAATSSGAPIEREALKVIRRSDSETATTTAGRKRGVRVTATKRRLYTRQQGGQRRFYADLRDLNGKREALKVPGEAYATTDGVIAAKLLADRLRELQEERRSGVLLGVSRSAELKSFAAAHLVLKARSGRFSESWLADSERMLARAIQFFGEQRRLETIKVADVQAWANHLATRSSRRRVLGPDGVVSTGTLGGGAVRHHLNVLSNLYRRAASEGFVAPGFNPVAALMDKPHGGRDEASWLEVHDAALLLESARTYVPSRADVALPYAYALIATYLLTGGRETEVLGLEISDVDFERRTIRFRPNSWRRIKTTTSHRTVPLWPQLEPILRAHIKGLSGGDVSRAVGLLFPTPRAENPQMISDFRKMLDAVAERAGWKPGEIRSKMFRHTYCAARLQTLDRGAPVSVYTVGREMGHGGDALVRKVYGHLGEVRHRSECVEYRVSQHRSRLAERLVLLKRA